MVQFQRLKIAFIILTLWNCVGAQEPDTFQLARGDWKVEYEGNVMEVQFIERRSEYQAYWNVSPAPSWEKSRSPIGVRSGNSPSSYRASHCQARLLLTTLLGLYLWKERYTKPERSR